MKTVKDVVICAICIGCFFCGGITQVFAAAFQNGNFETGDFTGWSGDLISSGTVDPDTDTHFNLINTPDPSQAWVATVQNDDTDWMASLLQDFTLDTLNGPGWTMDISFEIGLEPTDDSRDTLSVTLSDSGYTDTVDLLSGVSATDLINGIQVTQDITAFAQNWEGQEVELLFTVSDGDYSTPDSFSVENISFTQHAPAPVPLPPTILLLGSGLCGLAFAWRKKRG